MFNNSNNVSITGIINPPSGACYPNNNKYFNFYAYEDEDMTAMMFKAQGYLLPSLECKSNCQSCKPDDKSNCTSCFKPLM